MSLWSKVKKWFGGEEPPRKIPPPEPPKEPPEPPGEPPEEHDRAYWLERVIDRKERIWGETGRYNVRRATEAAARGVSGHRPSLELLKWAATTDEQNLHLMIRSGDLDYSFLFYKLGILWIL